MYAYVDESGNTGSKIFDADQPFYLTAATLARSNIDVLQRAEMQRICAKIGVPALHANKLGVGRIENIADDLLKIIKKSDAYFYLSRIEKAYLASTKIFDTYFDPFDNKAVPWQAYNIRQLRLLLCFKLSAYLITKEIATIFWQGLMAPKEAITRDCFVRAAEMMLESLDSVPDHRSRQIFSDGLQWALENPESFSVHVRDKLKRNSHTPNFVGFTLLLRGIDERSKIWKSKVREIVHDQQSEFEKTFKMWHEVVSDERFKDEKSIKWFGDETGIKIGKAAGSNFRIASDETSSGLQITDTIIWLYKRLLDQKEIGPRSSDLMDRVFMRARQNDFTFQGVGQNVEQQLNFIMNAPISDEALKSGGDFIVRSEANRKDAVEKYLEEKLRGSENFS